jgi:iron complex outermembrane recepter protein
MAHFIILFLTLLAAQTIYAQNTETDSTSYVESSANNEQPIPVEPNKKKKSKAKSGVEKLEVTGSYIRRTDVEGPSPVLIIDREQIEKQGFNTVGDVLRRSAVSPFGGNGSSVNLKGIGSARTLILINGQRAPGSGSSYATGAVDTNFVPITAVERIEILKDGASATYGSDALGGVVNIITRKDLDGFSFANKYDMVNALGADTNLTSLAYGTQTSDSNFLTSLQVRARQGSRSSAFDYARNLNRSFPFSTNYVDDSGAIRPGPNCTQLNSLGRCEEDVTPRQITHPAYSADWVTDYSRDLGNNTTFYTTFIAGYSRSESEFPNILNTPGQGIGLGFSGANTPTSWNSLDNYSGGDTRVFHRFDDFTNRSLDQNYYGSLIAGLKGYIGDSNWQWDVTANNQININESKEYNLATVTGARSALESGAYNPFDLSQRDTTGLGIDGFLRNYAVVNWVEAKANGELGKHFGLDWSSAFGVSGAHFSYSDHRPADIVNGNVMMQSGVVGRGSRELLSLFSEVAGFSGNSFELQLSGRADIYSDFGSTFNPKIAARYQAFNWLTFRSSAGTGFQAPTLQDMNARLEGYNFLVDQVRCKDPTIGNNDPNHPDCRPQSISSFRDTNANLREERSISFNFGTIIEPVKSFNISVDFWYVKVTDTIGVRLNDILLLEERGTNPNDYGVNVIRENGDANGRIERITSVLQNLGVEEVTGVDIDLTYKLATDFGDFRFSNETVYLGNYHTSFYQELGREQVVGQFGRARWRNNFTLGYNKDNFGAQAIARSVADMERSVRGFGKIVSPTQYDLQFTYQAPWEGRFELGVINFLNIRPRFDETLSSRINANLFNRLQTFYLTYRQDF